MSASEEGRDVMYDREAMETCPPVGRPEIAQASWDDLERWRNAPSGTASAWDAEQEADHAD